MLSLPFFLKSQTLNFSFSSDSIYPGDTLIITNTSLGLPDSAIYIFSFANRNLTHPHQGDSAYESLIQIGKKSFSLIPKNSGFFTVSLKMLDTNLTSQILQKNYYVYNKSIGCYNPYGNCNVITNTCFTAAGVNPAEWGMGFLFHAACWDNATLVGNVGSWYRGADFFNQFSTNMDFKIPYNNWVGPQDNVCGTTMAGFIAYMQDNIQAPIPNSNDYNRNYREYPSIMIVNPNLIPGQRYHAQMDVSLAENSKIAVQNIGMYFGWSAQQSYRMDGNLVIPQIIPRTPQIVSQNIISNTTDWTRVEGDFVSTGGNCLQIGNFSDDANTNIQVLNGNQTILGQYSAYYFLDNVRLIPIHENTSETISYCITSNVTISTKLHVDLRNTFLWSNGATTASITVNPTTQTTYSVTATDVYGCTKVDSYTITPIQNPITPSVNGPRHTCTSTPSYTITNPQIGTIYTWTIMPASNNYGSFSGSNVGSNVSIVWNNENFAENIPALLILESNNGCVIRDTIRVWKCCNKGSSENLFDQTVTSSLSGNYCINGTVTFSGSFTNNVNLYMGPEANIIIAPNAQITFNTSTFSATCGYMWNGIEVNPTAVVTMNNSLVKDALSAITSVNGGRYTLFNTVFNSNLVGIYVQSLASTHTGTVSKCTFKCTDDNDNQVVLMNPYSSRRSECGIKITDVNNIQIGNTVSTTNQNAFKNLDYGVYVQNSNVTFYNNVFGPLVSTSGLIYPDNGYGIFAEKGNLNGSTINIGNTSTSSVYVNTFSDCSVGVFAKFNYNLNIYRNTFVSPNQIMKYGAFLWELGNRTINITNNTITNPKVMGVYVLDIPYATLNIDNNYFYNTMSGANETQYNIAVANVVLSKIAAVNIRGNQMYSNSSNGLFKTGIAISNLEGYTDLSSVTHYPFVFSNSINYNTLIDVTTVTDKRCGIRVENCRNANIEQNSIACSAAISNDTKAARLTGIYVISSPSTVLCKNLVNHRGFGIQFDGNSSSTKIIKNELTNNFYGFKFVGATIGAQANGGRANDNKWISFRTGPYRAHGDLASASLWKYRMPTGIYDYKFIDVTDYINVPNLTSLLTTLVALDCGYTPSGGGTNLIAGQANLNNEAQEVEYFIDEVENKYYDRFNSGVLLSNSSQMISDVSFDNELYSNIPQFKVVNDLISNKNYETAQSLNQSIIPNNVIEQNMKTVNDIYLRTWAKGNLNIPVADYYTLIDIAQQSPITSGFGVIGAWVMTQRFDNLDEKIEGKNAHINLKCNTNIVISPNPAKEQILIEGVEEIDELIIYDAFGRVMFNDNNENQATKTINISSFKSGIYFIQLKNNNTGFVLIEKFVVL